MTVLSPPIAVRRVSWRAWSTAHPAGSVAGDRPVLSAAPIRPPDTVGGAMWESGARDGSGEMVDMLDVVLCMVTGPDCASAAWPTRSRTVRARANDPGRSGRNRAGAQRAEAGVGENFVAGCTIMTLLVRVDSETELISAGNQMGTSRRCSKCILITPACI
jgi:hypothetical protein